MSGRTKELYGTSGGDSSKNIYDSGSGAVNRIAQCDMTDLCLTRELLSFLFQSIDATQVVVKNLFPATVATSAFVTKIKAFAWMNDFTFVRFVWMQRNPDKSFNDSDYSHRYELLDIYYAYRLTTWNIDPAVNTLSIPSQTVGHDC